MSNTVPVNFRVLPTEREAWKQQAEKEGVSLTELVRQVMNARLGKEAIVTAERLGKPLTAAVRGNERPVVPFQASAGVTLPSPPGPSFERPRRTETCEHRLAPETFCRWCDG